MGKVFTIIMTSLLVFTTSWVHAMEPEPDPQESEWRCYQTMKVTYNPGNYDLPVQYDDLVTPFKSGTVIREGNYITFFELYGKMAENNKIDIGGLFSKIQNILDDSHEGAEDSEKTLALRDFIDCIKDKKGGLRKIEESIPHIESWGSFYDITQLDFDYVTRLPDEISAAVQKLPYEINPKNVNPVELPVELNSAQQKYSDLEWAETPYNSDRKPGHLAKLESHWNKRRQKNSSAGAFRLQSNGPDDDKAYENVVAALRKNGFVYLKAFYQFITPPPASSKSSHADEDSY